jgi:hypothetical protein
VEKELTGKDSEPWELIYFKVYRIQVPVIEQAIETAALMLGSDKSRGYCLEMICADFLAGAHLDGDSPEILLRSIPRYYQFLPPAQREACLSEVSQKASSTFAARARASRLDFKSYRQLRRQVLERTGRRCQSCGGMQHVQVHHREHRSQSGSESYYAMCRMPRAHSFGRNLTAERLQWARDSISRLLGGTAPTEAH